MATMQISFNCALRVASHSKREDRTRDSWMYGAPVTVAVGWDPVQASSEGVRPAATADEGGDHPWAGGRGEKVLV
jgi:hypothetical protein